MRFPAAAVTAATAGEWSRLMMDEMQETRDIAANQRLGIIRTDQSEARTSGCKYSVDGYRIEGGVLCKACPFFCVYGLMEKD